MVRVKKLSVVVGLLLIWGVARRSPLPRPVPGRWLRPRRPSSSTGKPGRPFGQRNPDLPLPPASTTKIVTALLALESGRLDDSLRVTPEAAQAPPSKISLRPGWKMRRAGPAYAVAVELRERCQRGDRSGSGGLGK